MLGSVYKKTLNILSKVPVKLWGLSLLSSLLSIIVVFLGILPIITIPVNALISAGMYYTYLAAYRGEEYDSKKLFSGFKNVRHVAGGMCWMYLWLFLWFLIPIVGIVFSIIKSLSYAYTPFILMEEPQTSAFDALKKSMEKTKGLKGQLFCGLLIIPIAYLVLSFILSLLSLIPLVGIIFSFMSSLISIIYSLFAPLFLGLVSSGFYHETVTPFAYNGPNPWQRPTPQPVPPQPAQQPTPQPVPPQPVQQPTPQPVPPQPVPNADPVCKVCGTVNYDGAKFCKKCGSKID